MAQMIYAVMVKKPPLIGETDEGRVPVLAFRDKASAHEQARRMGLNPWTAVVELPYIEELVDFGKGEHDGENH